MVLNDTLLTVFEARGATTLLNAFIGLEASQNRLSVAQDKFARAKSPNAIRDAWYQVQGAQKAVFDSLLFQGGASIAIAGGMVLAVRGIVNEYVALGSEIMNVRDLAGATTSDATRAVLLARAAGSKDPRALLDLQKDVFTPSGMTGLARLGISANPNQSGVQLFNQIADALDRYPNSLRKAQIMEQLFGTTGVQTMLPLLRLTKEQREQVEGLAGGFGGSALSSVQQFQFATNLLGLTFQQKIIVPLGSMLLPILAHLIDWGSAVITMWDHLNQKMGGSLNVILLIVGGLVAFGGAVTGIMAVIKAVTMLNTILGITDTLAAIMDGLTGNWAGIAVAAGAAITIGGLVMAANSQADSRGAVDGPHDKFSRAVDKFEGTVNRMGDSFDNVKGGAIPRGMTSQDLPALTHQMANGLIG